MAPHWQRAGFKGCQEGRVIGLSLSWQEVGSRGEGGPLRMIGMKLQQMLGWDEIRATYARIQIQIDVPP